MDSARELSVCPLEGPIPKAERIFTIKECSAAKLQADPDLGKHGFQDLLSFTLVVLGQETARTTQDFISSRVILAGSTLTCHQHVSCSCT